MLACVEGFFGVWFPGFNCQLDTREANAMYTQCLTSQKIFVDFDAESALESFTSAIYCHIPVGLGSNSRVKKSPTILYLDCRNSVYGTSIYLAFLHTNTWWPAYRNDNSMSSQSPR